MRPTAAFLVLTAVASLAGAQELQYVVCGSQEALEAEQLGNNGLFGKRAEGDGTSSKLAVTAAVTAAGRKILVAIDSNDPGAKGPDLIRLDFTGQGKFDNECVLGLRPVSRQPSSSPSSMSEYVFGPALVKARVDGRTIPITVDGQYYKSETFRFLRMGLTAAAEAPCKFGEKTYRVRVVDGTGNLKFSDPAKPLLRSGRPFRYAAGDTLEVDAGESNFARGLWKGFYGQPARVDGKWYDVALSADGNRLSASPANISTGSLQIGREGWTCKLVGAKNVLFLDGSPQPQEVPADDYVLVQYRCPGPVERAGQASLWGTGPVEKVRGNMLPRLMSVAAGKVTRLQAGPPLSGKVTATKVGQDLRLALELTDSGGGAIENLVLANGARPPEPKVTVLDADGKVVYTNTLEYG